MNKELLEGNGLRYWKKKKNEHLQRLGYRQIP